MRRRRHRSDIQASIAMTFGMMVRSISMYVSMYLATIAYPFTIRSTCGWKARLAVHLWMESQLTFLAVVWTVCLHHTVATNTVRRCPHIQPYTAIGPGSVVGDAITHLCMQV